MVNRLESYFAAQSAAPPVAAGPDSTVRVRVVAASGLVAKLGSLEVVFETGSIFVVGREHAECLAFGGHLEILEDEKP